MAVAIIINRNTKALTHVTGVVHDSLVIAERDADDVNDTDAVKGGVVFSDEGGSADQLKTYLTNMLTLMVAASDNADYRYLTPVTVGTAVGDGVAFYHSTDGTSHWTFKKINHANDQEPRLGQYSIEFNLDGDYDVTSDAKTFYDALLVKKNLL